MEFRYADKIVAVGFSFLRGALVLEPDRHVYINNAGSAPFLHKINHPTCGTPLDRLLLDEKPRNVVIVAEDSTRNNPEYPAIIERLSNIVFDTTGFLPSLLIAYGTHKQHTKEQDRELYGNNIDRIPILHHNALDDSNMVLAGSLKGDTELRVNRHLMESDFLIALGTIEPHAFAGFTGGGKLILPGVSAYESIRKNHAMISRDGVGFGLAKGNIIHEQMRQSADICGLRWLLHVIRSPYGGITEVVAGTWPDAYEHGVSKCQDAYGVHVKGKADVVVVSAGGHPKDKSLYQSQRAVRVAASVTKKGGTILLVACLEQGFGHSLFETLMTKHSLEDILSLPEEFIEIGGHSAIMMAKTLSECELLLVMEENVFSRKLPRNIQVMRSYKEAEYRILKKHGSNFSCYAIPNGSRTLINVHP